jgi:molybdopterin-dependent oxidoreductase alpha subunit
MRQPAFGGGWQAIRYTLAMGRRVGFRNLWMALRSRNACKTCALGMGGQKGGMVNERGHWPEVCKKSLQAMASDMQGRIAPALFEKYTVAEMRGFTPREMESLGRLAFPIYLGPGEARYREISWDEAIGRVAAKLKGSRPEEAFFYASGRSSNEAGFLLQLFARVYGTNHVNNCSYYCHQASGVGLGESLGTGTATVSLEDVEKADLFVLIGGNPASNHPRLMSTLMRLRRRGGRVVVINPVREAGLVNFRVPSDVKSMLVGSEIASTYVQPTIGGDVALLSGVAKVLVERGWVDLAYVEKYTEGFQELRAHVGGLTWEEIERGSGVARGEVERLAEVYAGATSAVFGWTMGITHHLHGVENVQWIVNVALLRGMVGREGAGLLPIRGHSNVQGMGSMGVAPALKKAVLERLEQRVGPVAKGAGYDTMACMEAAHRRELKFGLCLGGNLYGSNPDATFAREAIGKLETVVYLSTTLNTGHAHGTAGETIVLPVRARDEEAQATSQESMFNYVRISDGGPERLAGPRGEVEVLAEVAGRVLGSGGAVDWSLAKRHDHLRGLIASVVPGYAALEKKEEFAIPGRVLHEPRFAAAGGKARFRPHAIPVTAALEAAQVRVMSVRSEGQFNTVVYEDHDVYRGQERRDVILMNGGDMRRMGIGEGERVRVASDVGEMAVLARAFDVHAGCGVMYAPECNVLIPRAVDPRSRTPGFKSVVVRVGKAGEGLVQVTVSRAAAAAAPAYNVLP